MTLLSLRLSSQSRSRWASILALVTAISIFGPARLPLARQGHEAGSPSPPHGASLRTLPFQVGEELHFSLNWMGLPLGTATLAVPERLQYRDRSVLHLVATVRTRYLLSLFYPVMDRIDVHVDPDGWLPWWYHFSQRERGKAGEKEIVFDPHNGVATYREGDGERNALTFKTGALDPLSPLYYFRCQKIGVGSSVSVNVFDGKKHNQVELKVIRTERILTLWGEWETFVVKPELEDSDGISGLYEGMRVWLTTGPGRVPVKVKVGTSLGSIIATLTRAEGV